MFEKIKRGQYCFDEDAWGGISNEAKDLISGLLQLDPRKRLTATQALQHPWVLVVSRRLCVWSTVDSSSPSTLAHLPHQHHALTGGQTAAKAQALQGPVGAAALQRQAQVPRRCPFGAWWFVEAVRPSQLL